MIKPPKVRLRREEFICHVERDERGAVRAVGIDTRTLDGDEREIRLNGTVAARVAGPLHSVLRTGGVTGRDWAAGKPLALDQVTGAHAELLIRAVKPFDRGDRIDRLGEAVARMSREEAAYWHAKSHQPGGLPALRTLLLAGRYR